MQKLYLYLVIVVLIIITSACSKTKSFNTEYKPGESNADLYEKYKNVVNFEELFTLKSTIQLDSSKAAIISSAQKMCFTQDKVYILESFLPDIKCFNREGRFLFKVGRKGEGPGEYLRPISMELQNDTLFVYDANLYKLVKYNALSGRYIAEYKLKQLYHKMLVVNNKICLYNAVPEDGAYKKSVIDIYDKLCQPVSSIDLGKPDRPDKFLFLPMMNMGFEKGNREVIYYVNQCDLLLRYIDTQQKTIKYCSIELPKEVKLSDPPKLSTFENMQKFGDMNSIHHGLFCFNKGLVIEHFDNIFALYDSNCNYIAKVAVPKKTFHTDSEYLYMLENPTIGNTVSNGFIKVYELK